MCACLNAQECADLLWPLSSSICFSVTLTRQCTHISSYFPCYLCVSERTGQCMLACELDLLCILGFMHLYFCVCVGVNNQAWGNNVHATLGVFLGVLVSKWLPRIACTRPSKHSELCALGLTFHPAIVYVYYCINVNEKLGQLDLCASPLVETNLVIQVKMLLNGENLHFWIFGCEMFHVQIYSSMIWDHSKEHIELQWNQKSWSAVTNVNSDLEIVLNI